MTVMVGVLLALVPGMLVGGGLGVLFGVLATPRCRHPAYSESPPALAPAAVRVAADRVAAQTPVVVNVIIPGLTTGPVPGSWPGVVEGHVVRELPPARWGN